MRKTKGTLVNAPETEKSRATMSHSHVFTEADHGAVGSFDAAMRGANDGRRA
ncbi:MAG: hypothetical protein H5T95_05025 [Firmicutes bacterium]|nr:hypothetical protein [Bacillota bacterium]